MTGGRRAASGGSLAFCHQEKKAVPTHRVCGTCGSYMGKTVIKTGDEA